MSGWPWDRHRGLPDGTLNLVISIDAPLIIRQAGQADLEVKATISGLRAGPLDIIHPGWGQGVQIEITPPGSRALLGLPAAELANGVWALHEVIGTRADELLESLLEQPGPKERARTLDAVLSGWIHDVKYPSVVDATWRRLVASAGSVSIMRLADEAGLSRRHLSEVLRTEIGLTPKTAARVLRFAHARMNLRTGRDDHARGYRGQLRLLRPGTPDQRVEESGRLFAGPVDRRGAPVSPRPRHVRRRKLIA